MRPPLILMPFICEAEKYRNWENVLWLLLGLFALCLIEIGKHGVNEFVDYLTGVDSAVEEKNKTPFSGGRKTIIDGILNMKEVVIISVLTLGAAVLIGLAIAYFKSFLILPVGFVGVCIAVMYTLPPFMLSYRGLGELAVFLCYGPLIFNGPYVLITGSFSLLPVLVSIPIGIIIANILVINEFPDYEADLLGGKMNAVARLGKEKGTVLFGILFIAAYACFILIAIIIQSYFCLLPLITMPMAYKAWKSSKVYKDDIQKLAFESMFRTIKLHAFTGMLLIMGIIVQRVLFKL